jgi:hypothetical protein
MVELQRLLLFEGDRVLRFLLLVVVVAKEELELRSYPLKAVLRFKN